MPGGKGNIKPSDNPKPFKKGNNMNPNGRPRKLISDCIVEMEKSGVKETNSEQIKSVYLRLINLTIKELEEKVDNDEEPALTRIVGKNILSGKGFEIIEKMFDRSLGKPNQTMNHQNDGGKFDSAKNDLTPDQIDKLIDKL